MGHYRRLVIAALALAASGVVFASTIPIRRHVATVIAYSSKDPEVFRTSCSGECRRLDVETFVCNRNVPTADVLVLTGHSAPPLTYLGGGATRLAAVAACVRARAVVIDSCLGMSHPLVTEIASRDRAAWIVGSTQKLPPEGLRYGTAFFVSLPIEERLRAIETRSGARLERWLVNPVEVEDALDRAASWGRAELVEHLARKIPVPLVRLPLHGDSADILIPIEQRRFAR